jgi:hypothetical protein
MGRGTRAAAALMMIVWLAACGSDGDTEAAEGERPVASAADIEWSVAFELPEGWSSKTIQVMNLRTIDEHTLVVDGRVVKARSDDGTCVGEVGGWVVDEGDPRVVWIHPALAGPDAFMDGNQHDPCPEEAVQAEIDLPRPLGGRNIVVSNADLWIPDDRGEAVVGSFTRCLLPTCDPKTADPPAAASCDDQAALVDEVRTFGDVGRHASMVEVRCEAGWAMVEADIGAGACPPTDGEPNSCAGRRVDRLFLRAATPHWEVLTRTREAGCGAVTAVAPAFPTSLCEDRPALGP